MAAGHEELKGKVVVMTGASSGFGKGAAIEFAKAGASLVLAARRANLLEELARECETHGVRAVAAPTDVSKPEEVERLAQTAVSNFQRIDIWVNDAGVGSLGRFEDVPLADHRQVIETNLLGALYGSYYAFQQFRSQNHGTLINIASVVGIIPAPYYVSYTASKFGIVGMDKSLRQELRENKVENIHVCTIMPMASDTPFFDHVGNYTGHEAKPIPPVYDPKDVIDAILRVAVTHEDETVVGAMGKYMTVQQGIAPGLTEKIMGRNAHKAQMEDSPPAEDSEGSVFHPVNRGTGVSGGLLQTKEKTAGR